MYTDSNANLVYPDCYFSGYVFYMQRPDVLAALHIPDFLPPWSDCKFEILFFFVVLTALAQKTIFQYDN